MIKTVKYRLKDRSARKFLSHQAYGCNQVWNWCVAQHRDMQDRYAAGAPSGKWLTGFDLIIACKGVGKDLGILQQTVGAVCLQFARSRDQHRRCPRFRASFGLKKAPGWVPFNRQSRRIEGNCLVYAGRRFRLFGTKRRPVPADVTSGYFVEDALGRWFVCFQVEVGVPVAAVAGEIGIDLGLKSFATLSDGRKIEAPRIYRSLETKLAVAQRAGNRRQAKAIHLKIGNRRRDFHHKLSTSLARDHAFIAVGNVNAEALAKTRMAKSIHDAGWSAFRDMLRYKAARFAEVDERFTTQVCSCCGVIPDSSPKGMGALGIRTWVCSSCGESHDRDVNAARNILRLGLSAQPRDDESRRAA